MPIAPSDLLAPEGPVEVTLFPGESTTLSMRLQKYIDRAYEKTSVIEFPEPDLAAEMWALHLTFEAAYLLACSRASTDNTMVEILGSQTYSKDQRDALKAKSLEYKTEYEILLAAVPIQSVRIGPVTRQITNTFEY